MEGIAKVVDNEADAKNFKVSTVNFLQATDINRNTRTSQIPTSPSGQSLESLVTAPTPNSHTTGTVLGQHFTISTPTLYSASISRAHPSRHQQAPSSIRTSRNL